MLITYCWIIDKLSHGVHFSNVAKSCTNDEFIVEFLGGMWVLSGSHWEGLVEGLFQTG